MAKVANPMRKAEKMAEKMCNSLRTWWGANVINIERFGAYFIVTADIRGGEKAMMYVNGYKGNMSRNVSCYSEDVYKHMCELGRAYQRLDTLTNN